MNRKGKNVLIAYFLTILLSFGSIQSIIVSAATLDITLNQVETGSPNFDVNDDPGNDSSISNNIVRTNDTILYEWDFNVNGGSDDNITITQTLPNTAKWIFLPPQCGAGSSISLDEQTITCVYDLDGDSSNGNTIPSGTAVQLYPQAIARGTAANGDLITTSASIVGDNSLQADSGDVTAIVSAAPRYDVKKVVSFEDFVPADTNHPEGYYGEITALIVTDNDAKGNEIPNPAQDLIITDEILGFQDGNTPNSSLVLADWEAGYCETNYLLMGSGVANPGSLTCTQAGGAGTDITFTLSGADLTGQDQAQSNTSPIVGSIGSGETVIASLNALVFEPLSSIPENSVRYLENELTSSFPLSISNQTVDEYDLTNNDNTIRFRNLNSGVNSKTTSVAPYPWSDETRDLYASEEYESVIGTTNLWIQSHENVVMCDKFDHTTQEFSSFSVRPASANAVIDYGYKNFSDYADMENTTCGDSEPGVTWSSTPQSNTNIIRAKFTDPQSPGTVYRFLPQYKVRSQFFEDAYTGGYLAGEAIPNGYELWDFAAVKKDNFNNGDWEHTGDTMDIFHIFNSNIPEIEKTLSPDTGNNQFITGDTVTYSLVPTLRGDISENIMTTATVVDTLPDYLSYQPGTATLGGVPREPDTVIINGDETTTLTWVLPDSMVGSELDEILFSVTVSNSTPNFEIVRNDVVISTPDTLAPESERSDYQDIQVIKDAVFGVSKLVNTPQIYPEEQVEFVLEYVNSRSEVIPSADLIDIFPFNGDARTMATDFTGSLEFDSVSGDKGGETYYFTKADPTTINSDDGDPGNVINTPGATSGATIWCLVGDFGGDADCPSSNSEITAIRAELGSVPNDGVGYNLTLTFNTSGNQKGDIYTNHFEVEPDGLLQTISNEVSSIVIGSELGDYVWNDDNQNGIQDEPASSGINGVLATLWDAGTDMLIGGGDDTQVTIDASGNSITPQTTSNDASGNPGYYIFQNLIPSWYYVVFDNLPGLFNVTAQNDPSGNGIGDGSDDSDVNNDQTSSEYLHSGVVEIGVNGSSLDTDLGLFEEKIDLELNKTVDANQDGSFTPNSNFIESAPLPNINERGNSPIDYQISLNNTNGSINATGVEVTDYIPAGVTITAANPSSGSVTTAFPIAGPANLVWNVGTVNTTDTLTLDLEGYIASGDDAISGQFTNVTEVTAADQTDSDSTPDNIDTPFNYESREDDESSVIFEILGAVGNFVFEDTNGNGLQDPGETGIEGVTVNLYNTADTSTILYTTTSLGDGSYIFDNLDPELNYVVEFIHSTAPAGYVPTNQSRGFPNTDSNGDPTTGLAPLGLLGFQYNDTIDQGYIPLLSIGDFVFEDANGNGIQDIGEVGIENVTINLYNTADLTTPIDSTTSETDGSYSFNDLNPSIQYVVEFVHATTGSSYIPTLQSQGIDGEVDSDGDASTGRSSVINLTDGVSNIDIDQGYIRLLSLGDLIFEDVNNNGVLDGGEVGIEGVTINLYEDVNNDGIFDGGSGDTLLPFGTGSALPGTSVTDSNGNYLFTNLPAGGYFAVIPASNFNTGGPLSGFTPSSGQNGSASGGYEVAPDANTDINNDDNGTLNANGDYVSSLINLDYGNEPTNDDDTLSSTNTTIDFSLYRMSCLESLVWEDLNANGIRDENEPFFAGVEVLLFDNSGNQIGSTVSDENGRYEFCYLTEGDYYIEYGSLPLGYQLTSNNQDSQGDPSTFRTPAFSIGYNEQGQTLIQSGVVTATSVEETINLIRTGKVNLNRSSDMLRLGYISIVGIGIALFAHRIHALQHKKKKIV